jgi:hypothetical protein
MRGEEDERRLGIWRGRESITKYSLKRSCSNFAISLPHPQASQVMIKTTNEPYFGAI